MDLAAIGTAGALRHQRVTIGAGLRSGGAAMPRGLVDVDSDWFGQADAFAAVQTILGIFSGNPAACREEFQPLCLGLSQREEIQKIPLFLLILICPLIAIVDNFPWLSLVIASMGLGMLLIG